MEIEKTEEVVSDDTKKVDESQKTVEEDTSKEEVKDDFEKDSDVVSVGKYNQAVRKQREIEFEKRELQKQIEALKTPKKTIKKEEEEDEDEDFFPDDEEEEEQEKKPKKASQDVSALVDARVKPILEKLSQKEADEKKLQRAAFFEKYPRYQNSAEKWQELLDELDNSINPNSKDNYYKQLEKAHKIISDDSVMAKQIDKKKNEMASDSSTHDVEAEKAKTTPVDDRAARLAKRMPIGFTFNGKI
jgi:hypothetical protein